MEQFFRLAEKDFSIFISLTDLVRNFLPFQNQLLETSESNEHEARFIYNREKASHSVFHAERELFLSSTRALK